MHRARIDKVFLIIAAVLVCAGFFIFSSASLGLLTRTGAKFSALAFNQFFLGVVLGSLVAWVTSVIPYKFWKRHAFYLFLGSIVLTILVFVPGLGQEYGGAKRWISIFGLSFQPAEFLKMTFVIYLATWISGIREKITTFRFGLLPLAILLAIIGTILLSQPDTDTFGVIILASFAMYITAGGRWRDILIMFLAGAIGFALLVSARPYLMDRVSTFLNPAADPQGSGYQVQQSLIAIGSGQVLGRGFGQSIQKFSYLPEPTSDSIFAVAGEEFGFLGSSAIVLLFLVFALRGFKIAAGAPDLFGRLLVVGIVILIVSQSFMNIASMLGIIPLSGLPLLFISHGGTAMLFSLALVGIVLNVSKTRRS